jgi:hypothetical protein
MVAKVNGAIAAGSFVGHDIEHFSLGGVNCTTAANITYAIDMIETKATVVMIGALGNGAATPAVLTRVGVESPSAWTAATLQAALRADGSNSWTAAAFTY